MDEPARAGFCDRQIRLKASDEDMKDVLRTPRLLLRPLAERDRDLYCHLYTDEGVMSRIAAPLSANAALQAFTLALAQNAAIPPRARYWVASKDHGSGGCGLLALVFDVGQVRSAEMGILLQVSMQGRGHASEALAALAEHAFASFRLKRLWTRHRRDNQVVVRLMKALGFHRAPGEAGSDVRWAVEREQWLRGRRPAVFAGARAGDEIAISNDGE